MANLYVTPVRSIGTIELEASLTEDHESNLTVTSHPVERGANITDHATVEPKKVTITGGFSAYPIRGANTFNFGRGNSNPASRLQGMYGELVKLQASNQLLDVQTGLKLYKNMALVSLSVTQDVNTANVLLFRAGLQEIIVVDTLEVAMPSFKTEGETQDQFTSEQARGDVATPPVDTTTPRGRSTLDRLLF